jgi:hypothetical protein
MTNTLIPRPGCRDSHVYHCAGCERVICTDCEPSPGEPFFCATCWLAGDDGSDAA